MTRSSRALILADAGGSNGYRSHLWKARLHALAVQTGLLVSVCHFPPGTSGAFMSLTRERRRRAAAHVGTDITATIVSSFRHPLSLHALGASRSAPLSARNIY
jgi:hypothetical protein